MRLLLSAPRTPMLNGIARTSRVLLACRTHTAAEVPRHYTAPALFADALVPLSKRGAKTVTHELRALRSDAAVRAQKQQLVLFTRTLVEEYAARGGRWQHLFAAPECNLQLRAGRDVNPPAVELGRAELTAAAGVESLTAADACACVIPLPRLHPPPPSTRRVLVLDALSDPGNLGSVVRSALAFDFSLVLLGPGGCDPFSDKVIRSSMGACIDAPIYTCDEVTLVKLLASHQREQPHLRVLVSDVAAEGCTPLSHTRITSTDSVWVLIGNEARGVRPSLRSLGARVHIPMSSRVESLNAAVAAAIFMQHTHASMKQTTS